MTVRQQIMPPGVAVLVGVGGFLVGVAVGPVVVPPPASPGVVAVAVGPVEAPPEPLVVVPACEESAQAPMTMRIASRPASDEMRRARRKG
jgi:hypothetical protein